MEIKEVFKYYRKRWGRVPEYFEMLGKENPQAMKSWYTFRSAVMEGGAIPYKYKELMMLVLNCATRYEWGIKLHAQAAFRNGATKQEIFEAILVAGMTTGMPAFIEGLKGYKALE